MKHCLIILFVCSVWNCYAQDYKRTQNWYFGDSAGLSFATDPPTVLTDGAMNTIEGCATISDTAGNLLFYTNGVKVWNKNHQIMDNGTGLKGHVSSTQSSLIVPYPENDSLFYIFTTDAVGQFNGLQYSLVNIKENEGLGKVIVKNILLHTPVCEKLTATYHQNGKDIWVLAHDYNSENFRTYRVSKDGINNCPIIQKTGSINGISMSDAQGMLKLNSQGTLLANVLFDQSKIEFFSFNSQTAKLSFKYSLNTLFFPFGIEFSDSLFLYVLDRSKNIYQYNLNLKSEFDINQSKTIVGTSNALFSNTLQRSQSKIYIAIIDSTFIATIEEPNKIGALCGFKLNGINLDNKSLSGLPNFISSYFYTPKLDFTYSTKCQNNLINFSAKGGTSHAWQIFRNKAIIHTSAQPTMGFNFTDTGEYIVQLVSDTDTVTKTIYIEPKLSLGQDTILCNQNSYSLTIPTNHRCIMWQDGADSEKYTIIQSGKYYASAYNIRGCLVSDTAKVTFTTLAPPIITQNNDTLHTDSGYNSYKWYYNNNSVLGNTHTIKVTKNGNYRVEITDSNGCANTSTNFLVSGLGIQLLNAQDYFNIYPIPSENQLFIEPLVSSIIKEIYLIDAIGKRVHYEPTNILNLNHFAKGIYYLEIIDTENIHYKSKIIIN